MVLSIYCYTMYAKMKSSVFQSLYRNLKKIAESYDFNKTRLRSNRGAKWWYIKLRSKLKTSWTSLKWNNPCKLWDSLSRETSYFAKNKLTAKTVTHFNTKETNASVLSWHLAELVTVASMPWVHTGIVGINLWDSLFKQRDIVLYQE